MDFFTPIPVMPTSPPRITSAEKRGLIALLILLLLLSAYMCRHHLFPPSTGVSVNTETISTGVLTDSLLDGISTPDPRPEASRKARKRKSPASTPAGKRNEPPAPRSPRDEPVN